MDQLMEDLWSGRTPNGDGIWSPLVDIEETEDAWIIEAEVPGAKRDDINVEVRDSELSITGQIKERERKGLLRRRTRRTGRFDYRVTLPGGASPDGIEASLDDGVLAVRVPKPEQARPRHIEVKG
jgi:HSP20 family protein